jgi:NADH:ubiquinone reductase (non-electrogenic)
VRSIVENIRMLEKRVGEVIIGEAIDMIPEDKRLIIKLDQGRTNEIKYHSLVIAAGAVIATFDIPEVQEHCLFVKEMKDARRLREKILFQFDKASYLNGLERKRALTFVLVGAGATGVETACEIDDLIKDDLTRYYPKLAAESRIEIIEATSDILPAFDRTLARYAQLKLQRKGIRVRTELPVKAVEEGKVIMISGEAIDSDTIIWATGNGPSKFTLRIAQQLDIQLEKGGRIPVGRDLKVKSLYPDIYAIGDSAACWDGQGRLLPATAQVAMKQGIYLGKILSGKKTKPFYFQSMGMLASLGSGSAIADLGTLRFRGLLAWWFWKAAYLTRLVSLRNKLSVLFDWFKVKLFGRNTARIEF